MAVVGCRLPVVGYQAFGCSGVRTEIYVEVPEE